MSTSPGGTVTGYPIGVVGGNPHPTDDGTEQSKCLYFIRVILPVVLTVVFSFWVIFHWVVSAVQLEIVGHPHFEQVESATVTTQLNATVSEWNITLFAIYPRHHKISIEDLHAVAIYRNHRLRFDASPESFVMNKQKNRTLLNMKLTTGDDVGKEVDNDKRSTGLMSFALRMSACFHPEGSPWRCNCFIVVCDPIELGFNDNGTATMNQHAQCGWGVGELVK